MHLIAENTQKQLKFNFGTIKTRDVKEAITLGACINAENLDAKAILVFSKTGKLLSLVTKRRPNVDIFVFTDSNNIKRKMLIHWGAFPFSTNFTGNFDAMAKNAIKLLKGKKFLASGEKVIIVSDVNPKKNVDVLEIREIE